MPEALRGAHVERVTTKASGSPGKRRSGKTRAYHMHCGFLNPRIETSGKRNAEGAHSPLSAAQKETALLIDTFRDRDFARAEKGSEDATKWPHYSFLMYSASV